MDGRGRDADETLGIVVAALAVLAALAAGLATVLGRGEPPPGVPRHLVLVVFDTLRADRLELQGYGRPTSPFLRSLGPEVLRFARVSATAPWTVPSHASMFTGLLPSRHRASWDSPRLGPEHVTLAELLRGQGFATVGLSANAFVARSTGLDQGFERFESYDSPHPTRTEAVLEALPAALADALGRADRVFLFLNFMDAHIPYSSEQYGEAFGLVGPGPVTTARRKWEFSAGRRPFTDEDRRAHRAAYDAAVRRLDDVARELFAELDRQGVLDEALVVLTSDHGDGLGAHPELGHSISLWEEQLEVPLLVRFPDRRRGGEVLPERTSLVGLTPSVLDWLAVERPEHLFRAADLENASTGPIVADYRSYFSPLNQRMARRFPELAERVHHLHALYCERWKLVVSSAGGLGFYDLVEDPEEQRDLAPGRGPELEACLDRYRGLVAAGLFTPFDDVQSDEEAEAVRRETDLEVLRNLGYVL